MLLLPVSAPIFEPGAFCLLSRNCDIYTTTHGLQRKTATVSPNIINWLTFVRHKMFPVRYELNIYIQIQ
jgi:hypothetical protein